MIKIRKRLRRVVPGVLLACSVGCLARPAWGQNFYVGGVAGLATLSADGRSALSTTLSQISLYKPQNGPAVNVLAGWDFSRYLSAQGNYIWNRNDLSLVSTVFSPAGASQYEEARSAQQSSIVVDLLGYMRARGNRVRPYLSCGTGLDHFSSSRDSIKLATGSLPLLPLPPLQFSADRIALRVAVGIDLKIDQRWAFRYSFSESISSNPISEQLTPPGQRALKNFQNLFGFIWRF